VGSEGLGDELVAEAVKTVFAVAGIAEGEGKGIGGGSTREGGMEGGVKDDVLDERVGDRRCMFCAGVDNRKRIWVVD